MRWPWSKGVEVRDGYTDVVVRLLQGRADGGTVSVLSTAAVEIAAGWLSRSFAGVTCRGCASSAGRNDTRCDGRCGTEPR